MQLSNTNSKKGVVSDRFKTIGCQVAVKNRICNGQKSSGNEHYGPGIISNMAFSGSVLNCKTNQNNKLNYDRNRHDSSTRSINDPGANDSIKTSKRFPDVRLVFNICGEKFEVLESTVQRYPNTLLGDPKRREKLWDDDYKEYYLDRNRACFESILTYYQTNGILIRPSSIPDVLFKRELKFYELGDEVFQKFKGEDESDGDTEPEKEIPDNKLQAKIWDLFEYPETSKAARCIAWLSCGVVLVSIVLFCIETLPQFKDDSKESKSHQILFINEAVCIAWFTFEYLTRLLSSPNKLKFLKEPLNVIDLISILPFFAAFALNGQGSGFSSMAILRAVRLVRIFRIFKLSRYSTGLQILGKTLQASMSELGLLVFFLSVGVILFSSAIYYAEMNVKDGGFDSIPHSFWWAIVTMTTVGYGDIYPTTLVGKIIGSACACTGILAIALPVPVIVANFERFYSKAVKQTEMNADEKTDNKAANYKALKRFFDKIKQRNNNDETTEDHFFDMGEEVKANSAESSTLVCTSSV